MDAILQATLQVLVAVGKEKLTTTLVAHRAGVSVGTLYQYFPNKSALLQATLRRHLDHVLRQVEDTCFRLRNQSIFVQTATLIDTYLGAKLNDANNSSSLYAIAADVDGMRIARTNSNRAYKAVAAMFATSTDKLSADTEVLSTVLLSSIGGVVRRLLEDKASQRQLPRLRTELHALARAYLVTCMR